MRSNYSYGSSKKPTEMNDSLGVKLGRQYGQLKMLEGKDNMLRKKIQNVKYKVRGSNNGCIESKDYIQRIQLIQNKGNNSQLQQSLPPTCTTCLHYKNQIIQITQHYKQQLSLLSEQLQLMKGERKQKELQLQGSSELIMHNNDRNKINEIGKITRTKCNTRTIDIEQQTHQMLQLPSTPSSKLSYRKYFTSMTYLDSQQQQQQLRKIQQQVCRLKIKQKRTRKLLKELTVRKMEESMAGSSYSEPKSMSNLIDHKSMSNIIDHKSMSNLIDHDTTLNHINNTDITVIQCSNNDHSNNHNQHQLQTLNSIIKQLQHKILYLQQQNNTLAQNISKVNDQNQQYKYKLQRQAEQLIRRIRQLESHNQSIQAISKQLQLKQLECLIFIQKNTQLHHAISRLESEKQNLLSTLKEINDKLNNTNQQHVVICDSLLISQRKYQQLLNIHYQLKAQIQTQKLISKQYTQSIQKQKSSLQQQIQSLKQQTSSLQQKIRYLQQQIEQKNGMMDKKQVELRQKNQMIRKNEQDIKSKSSIIESSMNIIQSLNVQIQQTSTQLSSSNNQISTLSNKLQLLQIIELQLRKKANELECKLKNNQNAAQHQLKQIESTRRSIQYERDGLMVENNKLVERNIQLVTKTEQLTQLINLKQYQLEKTHKQLNTQREQLNTLNKQLNTLRKQDNSNQIIHLSQPYHKFPPYQSQLQLNSSPHAQTISYQHSLSSILSQHIHTLKSLGSDFISITQKFSILSQKQKSNITLSSQQNLIGQLVGMIVTLAKAVHQDRDKLNEDKSRLNDQRNSLNEDKSRLVQEISRLNNEKNKLNNDENKLNDERNRVQQYMNRQSLILNSQYASSPSLPSPQSIKDEPQLNQNQNLPLTLLQSSPHPHTQQQMQFSKQVNKHFSTSSISSVSKVDLNYQQQHQDLVNKSPQSKVTQHHKLINMQSVLEWNSSLQFITPRMEKNLHQQQTHVTHSPDNQILQYQTDQKSQKKKNLLFVQTLSDAASQSENQDNVDDFLSSKSSTISNTNSRHTSKHKSFLQGYHPTNTETHQPSDSNSMTKSAYSALTNKEQNNKYQQNIRNTKLKIKLKSKKK